MPIAITNCEPRLVPQPPHYFRDVVLLKQPDRGNARCASINTGDSVFERNATEREYRNLLPASLTQLIEAGTFSFWRILLLKHRGEDSEVSAVRGGNSNLGHGVTRNDDYRT